MVVYKDFDEALPDLDTWLKSQSHLPIIVKNVREIFLKICDLDMDKTKKLIDINYTIRNSYPNIFLERDPCDSASQLLMDVLDFIVLDKLDSKGKRITLCRLGDPDPEKFFYTEMVKLFLMHADARLLASSAENLGDSEIFVFDMKGFTLKHLAKYNFTTLKAFLRFTAEAMSSRIFAVHMINCPSILDKILAVVKPFVSAELFKLCHFHQPDSETLFEFVERDLLPNDYGGKAGTMKELKAHEIELLKSKRDQIIDLKYWKINESLRSKHQSKPDAMEGHFRTLNID